MDTQSSLDARCSINPSHVEFTESRFACRIHQPISCVDATELSQAVQPDWDFEFTQLCAGDFSAIGGIAPLDSALIAQITLDQPLLHRGHAPQGSVAVLIPGRGSGEAFVGGQKIEPAQCVVVADRGSIDAITRANYVDIALAVDQNVWHAQAHWLGDCSLAAVSGTRVQNPGSAWINRMQNVVQWIFSAIDRHPEALTRCDVRASLRDQFLAALTDFDSSGKEPEHRTRDGRVQQRLAVERARDYIRENLSEPLRLSGLCSHVHMQPRSLEYGFRSVTGLSPMAYVKSLRLNAVRRTLLTSQTGGRSISEIALDHGFWHLSQFAMDYRKFFGETPTTTRQRAVMMSC